ncbi:MAG: ATP-dependent Clp protease ATP-binding subunit [Candidatus Aureabacteria bacterium]|nr:ATP-dependent Clp protease ATP-binding subunit [Candidatus Auribacterota bacterium]
MFDRFTNRARQVIIIARKEADRFNHNYIGTEHILLGLIKLGQGVAVNVLRRIGLDFETVRMEVEKAVGKGPETKISGEIPLTSRAKKVIEYAVEEATSLNHSYVGTEHILLGLLREEEGVAARVLSNLEIDIETAREEILKELGTAYGNSMLNPQSGTSMGGQATAQEFQKSETPALQAFGRDLTKMAHDLKLDPVIGRQKEIERIIQILCRRTKNNPVLIGEAGVGKTAIVEGLAQHIVDGNVPEILRDKKLITLDLALMIAGTKYRGQFEERIKAVMDEIRKSTKILLFIDEFHTIVGAGAAEGAIDASNILKPALSRGELQCIGATTYDEYRKYIEKDSALERRFQPIHVDAPQIEETYLILQGIKEKYEIHHNARYTDEALMAAAELSDRYITGRFLPDKAIDVMDEAGSRCRISAMTRPPDLKSIEQEIEQARREKEQSIRNQEYEKAAALRDKEKEIRERLDKTLNDWKSKEKENEVVVDEEDVIHIVSKWTGVPLTRLEEGESKKLLHMEDDLKKRIVGQDVAVNTISRALRRSRADLKDPKRPIGSFLFLGPTGVGKTLLGKALAEFMFGNEEAIITIDMSEYMEKHNASRLMGSPPGYVGYEEGGQLSEQVRRRPYSVVLFDEVEKAHPEVMNLLLQVLEEGKLTDSLGRVVDFRNTIIIMTSNVGVDIIKKQNKMGFATSEASFDYENMKTKIMERVKKKFKPEFLNRIDDMIVFQTLRKEHLMMIVDIELAALIKRLSKRNLKLVLSKKVKEFLISKGTDLLYGARPLKRAIQKFIEDPLAEKILEAGELARDKNIKTSIKKDAISFQGI